MTFAGGCTGAVPVPVALAWVVVLLLLLLLLPPPDCAITNATTATTITSPSTAQRVPVFMEDPLLSVSESPAERRWRNDQTEIWGGPRPARNRASGSGDAWTTEAGETSVRTGSMRGRQASAAIRGSAAAAPRAASAIRPPTKGAQ